MTETLKTCPFCGGEAKGVTNYEYGLARGYFCYCTRCGIQQTRIYATKQAAIKSWNRRVNENDRKTTN